MARMPVSLFAAALLAFAVALPARALELEQTDADLLVLAPADADASLAVAHELSSHQWTVEASHGGILVIHSVSTQVAVPGLDLASLSSFQATWVPHSNAPTSGTLERLFGPASPSSLPFLFSSGVHAHVATASESLAEANDLLDALVKNAPTKLRHLLPDMSEQETHRVLARSLCASTGFTRHQQVRDRDACFSASFEFAEDASPPHWLEDRTPAHVSLDGTRPRLTAVTLRPSASDTSLLMMEVLSAFVTPSRSLDSSALTLAQRSRQRVLVVKSIESNSDVASVLSLADESETSQQLPRAAAAINGEIVVSVVGQGFHRRVRVELASEKLCAADEMEHGKALLVVPLSASVYADLDELRRMERFGKLKLHSPTKHIEIERPMAVSAQHVIALEFPIDTSERHHTLEFPIHLRYQSPSNATFYAPAKLIAPDVFMSCWSTQDKQPFTEDGPLDHLFLQWGSEDAWDSTNWRRVVPPSPLGHVFVPVPVGFTPHGPMVSAITLSVTGLGALLLVYVAVTAPKRASETLSMWKPKAA